MLVFKILKKKCEQGWRCGESARDSETLRIWVEVVGSLLRSEVIGSLSSNDSNGKENVT